MSRMSAKTVIQLPDFKRKVGILARQGMPFSICCKFLDCLREAVIPAFSFFMRAMLGPPNAVIQQVLMGLIHQDNLSIHRYDALKPNLWRISASISSNGR